MSRSCNGTIAFVSDSEAEAGAMTVYQVFVTCGNSSAPEYILEINTNISFYGFNVRSIVGTCEMIIKEYLKRQRIERNSALFRSLNMLNPRKPFPRRSNISISNSSDEDLLLDHSDMLFESVNQMSFHRSKSTKHMTNGSFLIISPLFGSWNINTLKNYISKVFRVECVHTKTILDSLANQSTFDIIIKFETSSDLNAVILRLRQDNINDNFLFLSFEKTSFGGYESDSSSDDSRCDF